MNFVRGDTCPLKFKIVKKNGSYPEMEEISKLTMTCRKYNDISSEKLIVKEKEDFSFHDDYFHFVIEPEDTRSLEYGTYNFDIECTLNNGYVKTLKSKFTLTEEDTIYEVSNE